MREASSADLRHAQRLAYRSANPFWWRNLAAFYATGEGTGRIDLVRARRWYRRAAQGGDATGMFELGFMYLQGEGGPKRPRHGRRLITTAAQLGELSALQVLHHAYSKGKWGFPRSPEHARSISRALRRARRVGTKSVG